jgi:hypothetical protein
MHPAIIPAARRAGKPVRLVQGQVGVSLQITPRVLTVHDLGSEAAIMARRSNGFSRFTYVDVRARRLE